MDPSLLNGKTPSLDDSLICPFCYSRNRLSANYCDNCGRRIQIACPRCGNRNRLGAHFCDNCGQRLEKGVESSLRQPEVDQPASQDTVRIETVQKGAQKEPGADFENAASLQRYIPEKLARQLESVRTKGTMVGERRIVTILFCDVEGSTAAAGRMDPEAWADIMTGIFEIMIGPIYKYEGIVARLMGDAILAFFGAPIAHEDDPQRAVLAGLEIVRRIQPHREALTAHKGLDLNLRVGINTGLVMVGQVGSDMQMEYTALGDAINIAARMEQTAQPGTVQVAEDTYRLAAALFEFEDLGLIQVKGRETPIHTYRPVRQKASPGQLRGFERERTALVGRAAELRLLQNSFLELRRGLGKVIWITGEAGLGKSRLIDEARQEMSEEDEAVGWYETAALSYESGKPYSLFTRLFQQLWDISSNEPPENTGQKIANALGQMGIEDESQLETALGALLGIDGQSEPQKLEGETLKQLLSESVLAVWRYAANLRPTVLVFDDLHWGDTASLELLARLFDLTEISSLLLICAMRDDPDSPSRMLQATAQSRYPHRYLEIPLHPLSSHESDSLVDQLFSTANLPEETRQQILEKTEGNPFFIEEMIQALKDRGALLPVSGDPDAAGAVPQAGAAIPSLDLPENLLNLLVARIDRLEEPTRRTLQLAAVIGRSFYYRVLQALDLAGPGMDLDHRLLTLQRADLICEVARLPELEYNFRHSLTQEAAYQTILVKQRCEYHLRVGEAIEKLFIGQLDEFSPILAHHFGQAGDPRVLKYSILSGDAAFHLYALREARTHYKQALEAAKGQAAEVTPDTWIHLYTHYGRVLELQGEYPAAILVYQDFLSLAKQRGDEAMELAASLAWATVIATPTPVQDPAQASLLTERALALAGALDDRVMWAKALWVKQIVTAFSGHMPESIPFGEQSAALARELGLTEQLAQTLQDLGIPYMGTGKLEAARQVYQESYRLWKEQHNLPMMTENLSNSSLLFMITGEFEAGIASSDEGYEISQRIGNNEGLANTRVAVSFIYLAQGEIGRAIENCLAAAAKSDEVGYPGAIIMRGQLAWIYAGLGDLEKAAEFSQQAYEDSSAFLPFQPFALACQAEITLMRGDLAGAKRWIDEADQVGYENITMAIDLTKALVKEQIVIAEGDYPQATTLIGKTLALVEEAGARYFLPGVLRLKACALIASGQLEDSLPVLQAALQAAQEIGFRSISWKILADLAQICEQRGAAGEAETYRQEARQIIAFLAEHTPDPDLRTNFLQPAEARLAGARFSFFGGIPLLDWR